MLKTLGDGLMAVFGYPPAEETDAERAVRPPSASSGRSAKSTLEMTQGALPSLRFASALRAFPSSSTTTGDVFGEAPNIAARVQAAAEPGAVLVTSTVQQQVAGLFIVEDKGPYELKGALAP